MADVLAAVVSIAVLVLGATLAIVAVATPYWTVVEHTDGEDVAQGLFEICYRQTCLRLDALQYAETPDSILICRGFNISGILMGGVASLISSFWLIQARVSSNRKSFIPSLTVALCLLASIFIAICLIVYGIEIYQPAEKVAKLGYSVFLNSAGAFLLVSGGVAFRVVAGSYMKRHPECSSGVVLSVPERNPFDGFYNLEQSENGHCQGLAYQQPQSTVLQPPPPYSQVCSKEEGQKYVAHISRDMKEGEYTPGETRKAAPGSTSI